MNNCDINLTVPSKPTHANIQPEGDIQVQRPLRLKRPIKQMEDVNKMGGMLNVPTLQSSNSVEPSRTPATPPRIAPRHPQFSIHNTVPRCSATSRAQTLAEAQMLESFREALEAQKNGWAKVAEHALEREKKEKKKADEAKKELTRAKAANAKLRRRLSAVAKLIQEGSDDTGSQVLEDCGARDDRDDLSVSDVDGDDRA